MLYPIVIHKESDSDYGVSFPDLPGCISAGSTIEEAMWMAREAGELWMSEALDHDELPPEATAIETLRSNPTYGDAVWAIVSIDAKRISEEPAAA